MEFIGWSSSVLFAICAIPQAYHCWKSGKAEGMSLFFLWTWLIGEILGTIYVIYLGNLPLIFNYLANLLALMVIVRYKHFPRKVKHGIIL